MIHGACKTCKAPMFEVSRRSLNGLTSQITVYCPACDKTEVTFPAWPLKNYLIGFAILAGFLSMGQFWLAPLGVVAWILVVRSLNKKSEQEIDAKGQEALQAYLETKGQASPGAVPVAVARSAALDELEKRIAHQQAVSSNDEMLIGSGIGLVVMGGALLWLAWNGNLGRLLEMDWYLALFAIVFSGGCIASCLLAWREGRRLDAAKPSENSTPGQVTE